jgi:hypothetical protein
MIYLRHKVIFWIINQKEIGKIVKFCDANDTMRKVQSPQKFR